MLAINDIKAAKTPYEKYLLKHGVPRAFWKMGVEQVSFLPFKINRSCEGTKKLSLVKEYSDKEQASYWEGLKQLIPTWNPSHGDNPNNNLIVFCSEDEKSAQCCMYTLVHLMLTRLHQENPRSYKVNTYRYYELWKLLQLEDPLDTPNVIIIPTIVDEGNANQYTSFRELLTSSFQILCCTSLGPQAFFNKYHILPGYLFYIDRVLKLFPIK
jgi:hypothetical protein